MIAVVRVAGGCAAPATDLAAEPPEGLRRYLSMCRRCCFRDTLVTELMFVICNFQTSGGQERVPLAEATANVLWWAAGSGEGTIATFAAQLYVFSRTV